MNNNWVEQVLLKLTKFAAGPFAILIRLDQQKLYFFADKSLVCSYPVSSSRYGSGCKQDSYQTPTGIHRVADKIGHACRRGEILRARVATGEIAPIITDRVHGPKELITSRILWLQGLEPGVNRGEGVDSYRRYIYIHGTNEEGLIGQPASIGCIRMKNDDVMDLFDRAETGTPVCILAE